MKTIRCMMGFAVATTMACSCDHKDIMCPYDTPQEIDVAFAWDNAPQAEIEGMTLHFYGNGHEWRFDIAGRNGGKIELPPGKYSMLAVNNDLPGISFSGEDDYDTFTANAREAGKDIVSATGMLYGGSVSQLEITPCGVSYLSQNGEIKRCPYNIVRCYPDSMSTVYSLKLTGIKGIERLRSARGRLKGMASQLNIADAEGGSNACCTMFPLVEDNANGVRFLKGATSGLGCTDSNVAFTLYVDITRTDGKSFSKSFDVTQQVVNSIYPRNVLININGIEIPDGNPPEPPADDDDVGISVGVDGWQVIDIYL